MSIYNINHRNIPINRLNKEHLYLHNIVINS